MINQDKIKDLYDTISADLAIEKFANESNESYHNRLVYSALGKWILALFSDRDFEDDDNDSVSKSHVTIAAMNILASYKKMDNELSDYFCDDNALVKLIENSYLNLGYIKSGTYFFKKQDRSCRLSIANKTLDIDIDSRIKTTKGLGIWIKSTENDIKLNDFLLIKESAEVYSKKLISQLKYSEFNSDLGKNEIYNINKNRWEYYSKKLAIQNEFSIIKVDDGLDYKVIKIVGDVAYAASLPTIYTKQSSSNMFMRDIWRIILGICSLNGRKAKCYLKNNSDDSISFRFKGFILPYLEDSIIRCMSWPIGNCLNCTEFVTDAGMKQALFEVLTNLSIEIYEGE